MLRSTTRTALVVLFVAAGLAALAAFGRPAEAVAARPSQVTRALDYLHAHQGPDGRFQDPAFTPWAVIAIAAAGEDPGGGAWTVSGRSPMDFLQSLDLDAYATQNAVGNAPAYYAKMILAYAAAGRREYVAAAGSRRIDLVARLLTYQRADGRFSPSAASDAVGAVNTTTWAIIALRAAGAGLAARADAVAWLKGQQLSDGGFANMAKDGPGTPVSDVDDTAAAIQAFVAGGVAPGAGVVTGARAYLQSAQRSDGGFSADKSGGFTYAESTAWAVQAIIALGEDPGGAAWTTSGGSAVTALRRLQAPSGAFLHKSGTMATPLLTTPQSSIALAGRTFATFPRDGSAWVTPFAWSPRVTAMTPAQGAQLGSSAVAVRATFRDGAGGTGIAKTGVRLTVDGRDMTSLASVTSSSLSITLTGAAAGRHTIAVRVRDRSGNARTVTRAVTVGGATAPAAAGGSAGSSAAAGAQGDTAAGADTVAAPGAGTGASGQAVASEDSTASGPTTPTVPFPSSTAAAFQEPSPGSTTAGVVPGVVPAGPATSPRPDAAPAKTTPLLMAVAVVPTAVGMWLTRRTWRRWRYAAGGPPPRV